MKQVFSAPGFEHYPDAWHFSPAVERGGFLFLAGQTGVHADGTLSEDPETQFRDAFSFVGQTLAAAGLSYSDVVEMTTYHVGLRRHLAILNKVKDEFVAAPYPAWTAIGVSELMTQGALLEVRVIAKRS